MRAAAIQLSFLQALPSPTKNLRKRWLAMGKPGGRGQEGGGRAKTEEKTARLNYGV